MDYESYNNNVLARCEADWLDPDFDYYRKEEPITHCALCGRDLYEGDRIYDFTQFNGLMVCEDCKDDLVEERMMLL